MKKIPQSRRTFLSQAAMGSLLGAGVVGSRAFGAGLTAAVDAAPKMSAPSKLKITDIKCGYIRKGFGLYVKVMTNQDIWGCGQAVDAVPGTYHLVKLLAQRLEGQNPLNVNRLFEDLRRGGHFWGAQAGMLVGVLTAIETALWDLVGKALGLPVYQLLGGKFRDRIRVYLDTAVYHNKSQRPGPEAFAAAAREGVKMGFTAVKIDLDQRYDPKRYDAYNWTASPGEVQRMVDEVAAVREAVGPEIDVCADMHGRYDAPTGERVARALEPFKLMWLEEPVPAENIAAYKRISDATSTPICTGENQYLGYGFREMLETGAVDIVMPDLQKCGGLGEGQRIANLANLYYTPFAPHMVASFLGAMASCHVCASVPNFMILEWQMYFHQEPMFDEIVTYDGPKIVDGFIPLSDKPGIGVEINEEGMRKYAVPGIPFFE